MAQSTLGRPDQRIEASIRGDISGQVAVGSYIVQVGSMHGGVIYALPPEDRPRVRPRSAPVVLRPRPFPGLLNRDREAASALAAILAAQPLEVYGQEGIGKSSLLRRLAYEATTSSFPDGIVCLPVHGRPLADVLYACYDAFYESTAPLKPTVVELRQALQGKRALIFLDDLDLAREEISELLDVVPGCALALTSEQRRLWGEGKAEALEGLPPDDALQLVERELGRALAPEEQSAAQALCAALGYHPLHIIQATALIREEHHSFLGLAQSLQTGAPAEVLRAAALSGLTEAQRQVLEALAAIPNTALTAEHVAAVTGISDPAGVADSLERRGLVREERGQYRAIGTLALFLRREGKLAPWAERLVASLTLWAERRQHAPEQLRDYLDTLLAAVAWAGAAGRWREVLRLGRAIDGALILSARWGAWEQVLHWALQAAQAVGDPAAEAWAMQQLGTRALCLGDNSVAHTSLARALELRTSLGDQIGAAVTRHNLELVAPPPPVPPRRFDGATRMERGRPLARLPLYAKVALGLALVAAVSLGAWLITALTAGGGAGAIEFTPGSGLVFADQEVGTSGTPKTVTLANRGSGDLTVSKVDVGGANAGDFRITSNGCTEQHLSPGKECSVALTFTPSTVGTRSATVQFTDSALGSPHRVSLSGVGIRAPTPSVRFSVSPNPVDFGNVALGETTSRDVTVTNNGTGELAISSAALAGARPSDFGIAPNPCPGQPLPAGKSCKIALTFTPTALFGPQATEATLVIHFSGTDAVSNVALRGRGKPVSLVRITVNPQNPTVPAGRQQTFTATGTYSDRSQADLTGKVAWKSTNTGVATLTRTRTSEGTTQVVATAGLTAGGTTTITATQSGITGRATLTVGPPVIESVTVATSRVAAGDRTTGTVKLSAPAPAAGVVVTLTSSNTNVATVPERITVPSGQASQTFTIQTKIWPVGEPYEISVDITASQGGTSKGSSFTTYYNPIP